MKTTKLSLIGYSLGLFAIIVSTIRYQFIYNDWFKLLAVSCIGSLLILVSYLYSWMRMKDEEDKKQTDRLDAIVSWWMKYEKEDVINRARGLKN